MARATPIGWRGLIGKCRSIFLGWSHLSLTSRFGIMESNLGLEVISAGFQISGNVEDEREALMIDVTKGSMIGRQSLMT